MEYNFQEGMPSVLVNKDPGTLFLCTWKYLLLPGMGLSGRVTVLISLFADQSFLKI